MDLYEMLGLDFQDMAEILHPERLFWRAVMDEKEMADLVKRKIGIQHSIKQRPSEYLESQLEEIIEQLNNMHIAEFGTPYPFK